MKIIRLILLSLISFFGIYSSIKFEEVDRKILFIQLELKKFDSQFYETISAAFGEFAMEFSMIDWAAQLITFFSFILIVSEIIGFIKTRKEKSN